MCVIQFQIFAGFFDTTSGSKTEAQSYKNIKAKIAQDMDSGSVESEEILFLTDNPEGNGCKNVINSNIKFVVYK